jgi:hypothetical protein
MNRPLPLILLVVAVPVPYSALVSKIEPADVPARARGVYAVDGIDVKRLAPVEQEAKNLF